MMKLYLVSGTHPHSTTRLQSLRATETAAWEEAHRLISLVAADLSYDDSIAAANDWEAHLATVKADNAEDFDVWIDELEFDVPAGPVVLEDLLESAEVVAQLLDEAIDTHIYDDGDDRTDEPYTPAIEALRSAMQMARLSVLWQTQHGEHVGLSPEELLKLQGFGPGAILPLSPPCEAMAKPPIRVAVGVNRGMVQWTLADGPGAHVTVLDFDCEDQPHVFNYRLITDAEGDQDAASVWSETPDVDPAYFARIDAAPLCNTGGDVYGDDDEDQVEDLSKWLVTAEIGILGPEGGTESYSGFIPADDAEQALKIARVILGRRHEDTGVKVWSMKAVAPSKRFSDLLKPKGGEA